MRTMTKRFFSATCMLAVLSIYGCGGSDSEPAPQAQATPIPPAGPKVLISPISGTVTQGNTFSRTVVVQNVGNAFYAAFDVAYDPAVVEFVSATEDGFLSRNGADQTSFQVALQDGQQGKIAVGVTRLGQIGDVSGTGQLLTLSFRAVGPGTTALAFSNPREIKNSSGQNTVVSVWDDEVITVQ